MIPILLLLTKKLGQFILGDIDFDQLDVQLSSGSVQLSDLALNVDYLNQKLDADICIDPVELRLHPSTIMWMISLWESLENLDKDECFVYSKGTNSVYYNSTSQFHPSTISSVVIATDKVSQWSEGGFPVDFFPKTGYETTIDPLLQGSHVIPDWVPLYTHKSQNDRPEARPDFGASVDQFFQCFDGLRTSQSALGSSGVWNWTCYVFCAITAASSLDSGSLSIPCEHQHVRTNLKATIAGVAVVLSLHEEDQKYSCAKIGNLGNGGRNVHFLGVNCQDILLDLQAIIMF